MVFKRRPPHTKKKDDGSNCGRNLIEDRRLLNSQSMNPLAIGEHFKCHCRDDKSECWALINGHINASLAFFQSRKKKVEKLNLKKLKKSALCTRRRSRRDWTTGGHCTLPTICARPLWGESCVRRTGRANYKRNKTKIKLGRPLAQCLKVSFVLQPTTHKEEG